MIRAVIFDYGGVLQRTLDYTSRAELAERFGMTRQELEDYIFGSEISSRAAVGEFTAEQLWLQLCAGLKWPNEQTVALQDAFWGGDVLDKELVDYIRSLRPRYQTALLSNAWSDLRQYLAERDHILDAFDEVIVSAEVGLAKPDPRIYRLVVDRLSVQPQEAVFVDDMPENVAAAREVGLHAIQFRSPEQARHDLDALLQSDNHREEAV